MSEAAFWWVNQVQVEPFKGRGTRGPVWDPVTTVDCWVEDGNEMVRDGEGNEVVSSAAVHGPLDQADLFVPGSRVQTAASSRPQDVLTLERFDSGSLGLDLEHFVARLK